MWNVRLRANSGQQTVRAMSLSHALSLPDQGVAPGRAEHRSFNLAEVRIRPIRPSDLEIERRFVYGLSARSHYLRLLSGRGLLPGELERWTNIDPQREIALIAIVRDAGTADEEEIAVARAVVDDSARGHWDFAIVVADAWQGRGLGALLLGQLLQAARAAGATVLGGITLAENRGMLALARKLGFHARREPGDATVMRLELRLAP